MKPRSSGCSGSRKTAEEHPSARYDRKNDFLIAAIGASAGGIEAFTDFITNLPADTGMAFVLIQHLDPTHQSLLTELFSKRTSLRVKQVTDRMKVEPNHIYIIPPNADMSRPYRSWCAARSRSHARRVRSTVHRFSEEVAIATTPDRSATVLPAAPPTQL